tara:strand:+ start:52 stop:387 length:336 start_codon:yes stop_codon:yes gene_type:complete
MKHEIKRAHLLNMTYSGYGKYTVTWKDHERKTIRVTLHADNSNHFASDHMAQEASERFISWMNNTSPLKNEIIIKSITICGNGPDKHVIALQTDFVPFTWGEDATVCDECL